MDTLYFHYFSATGNTERAVRLCASELAKLGHQVHLVPITRENLDHPAAAAHTAVHVIAFPALGFGPPALIKRYIRRLAAAVTKETGLRSAVLCTWGGVPLQALVETEGMLRRRGFEVLATGGGRYPFNWTQMINPPSADRQAAQLTLGDQDIREFSTLLASRLIGGTPLPTKEATGYLQRCGIFNQVWSGLVQVLFNNIGRRILGSVFVADRRCTACGKCARECPVGTIRMKGQHPAWGGNCLGCNRCINRCPEQAIQLSVPLLTLQTVVNFGVVAALILTLPGLADISPLPTALHGPAEFALGLGLFVLACALQLGPFNRLLQMLARTRLLNGFLSLSWTGRFRRYPAPENGKAG